MILLVGLARGNGQVEPLASCPGTARPARRRDDIARDDDDVLVPECAQHGQAGVVGEAEIRVVGVLLDVFADVGHMVDVLQELGMGAGHVLAHFLDEAVSRDPASAFRRVALLLARGTVLDSEGNVVKLKQAALRIASSGVLAIRRVGRAVVVKNTLWQSGVGHVLASSEKRPDAVEEDVGVASLVDSLQQVVQISQDLGKGLQVPCYGYRVTASCGRKGLEHERHDGRATSLNGDRNEVEPRLVDSSGKGRQRGQVLHVVNVLVHEQRLVVPQAERRISRHRRNLQMLRDGQVRNRDLRRQTLGGHVVAPDVAVGHEAQQRIGPTPLGIVLQAHGRQHRQAVDDAAQPASEDQCRQVGRDGLPFVVVGIWEAGEGESAREKAMSGRDVVVSEDGNWGQHGVGLSNLYSRSLLDGSQTVTVDESEVNKLKERRE